MITNRNAFIVTLLSFAMKTKNEYVRPIDKDKIKETMMDSPGHIIYEDKETGNKYDVTKAVDFICDEGVSVRVVADGTVYHVFDEETKNYSDLETLTKESSFGEKEGNFLVIKHRNREFSQYSHLQYGSISVKNGESVRSGQVIAKVGNTGLSKEPHLHFMVFTTGAENPSPGDEFNSLNVVWKE